MVVTEALSEAGGDKMCESVLAKNKIVCRRRGKERVLFALAGDENARPER
jgi:hypothetical protein